MYDVIIVGAGPAGAGLAIRLARTGGRVLMLDQAAFPRPKACGGGIDSRAEAALRALGVEVNRLCRAAPTSLVVTAAGRHHSVYHLDRPLATMVRRSELDALAAQVAVAVGAEFHDDERVQAVADEGGRVAVQTDRGRYEGRVLVGADGVYSLVARRFGLNRQPILYVLVEAEIEAGAGLLAERGGQAQIDLTAWPLGYSWVFPKGDHLNVGSGVPRRCARDLESYHGRFRQRCGLSQAPTLARRAHMLGFRRGRAPLAQARVLLVGDAAGLVDPNTGGGIAPALRSAELAAETISAYLSGQAAGLHSYSELVDEELGHEFRQARILRNTIVLRLLLCGPRTTGHRSLWSEAVRVIRGEERYEEWYAHSRLARLLAWTGAIPL